VDQVYVYAIGTCTHLFRGRTRNPEPELEESLDVGVSWSSLLVWLAGSYLASRAFPTDFRRVNFGNLIGI
jgi:hypothetical protein